MKKAEFQKWNKHINTLLEKLEMEAIEKHGATADQLAQLTPVVKRKLIDKLFNGKVSPEAWSEVEAKFGSGDMAEIPVAPDFELGDKLEKIKETIQAKDEEAKKERWSLNSVINNLTDRVRELGAEKEKPEINLELQKKMEYLEVLPHLLTAKEQIKRREEKLRENIRGIERIEQQGGAVKELYQQAEQEKQAIGQDKKELQSIEAEVERLKPIE